MTSGGTTPFSTTFNFTPAGTVGSTVLTIGQMPSHFHGFGAPLTVQSGSGATAVSGTGGTYATGTNGSNQGHTHSLAMNVVNLAPNYVDAIFATKD